MKSFLRKAYQSDHILEIIFSSSRWFFLVVSILVFWSQYEEGKTSQLYLFVYLVLFGVIYMALADLCLHKAPIRSKWYTIMTKGSPVFDYIAYLALIALTGGIDSPLFPIGYLIILHASVYWKFTGALITSVLLMLGYSGVFVIQGAFDLETVTYFISQLVFLFLVGFIGGLIVSRERQHFLDKSVLEGIANRDFLTNLLNHRSFQEHLKKAYEQKNKFYLVLADVDKFKQVNDKYGHVVGDQVLQRIATILEETVSAKFGNAFRYGGEEFALILYNEEAVVKAILSEMKDKIAAEQFIVEIGSFSVTMSFGCIKHKEETPLELIEEADKLLYTAKEQGRNRIVFQDEKEQVTQLCI